MSVRTLHRPTHRDTLDALQSAFERGDMVTVFGRCTVEYEGRAASSLGPGDRLLVLKPDGTALVHTDENRTPVNWQPPGCEHRAAVRDGRLVVRSERTSPDESLEIRFRSVAQIVAYDVTDEEALDLQGSEEDLRQRILDSPALVEPGFDPEATERETAAGPVDVFGADAEGVPVVVELKRRRVGPDAAGQLSRYVEAVEREIGDEAEVRGILVAPSVTDRAADLLETEGLEHVSLTPGGDDEAGDGTCAGDEADDVTGGEERTDGEATVGEAADGDGESTDGDAGEGDATVERGEPADR